MNGNLSDNLMPQDDYGIESPQVKWGADDVIILVIGGLLSLYTMWRSADFLSQTIPNGLQFRELVIALGIVGMDVSMWAWAFTWLHWARTKTQKNLALGMFVLTSFIVSVAAITDAAIYFFGGQLEESVRVMAFFIVIGGAILVAIAAFAYHNISPKVQVERGLRIAKSEIEKKRAQHFADFETKRLEHQADMEKRRLTVTHQLQAEQQDLELSEQLVRSRNAMVERAKQVARLKTEQDGAFEELHNVMRFVNGGNGNGNGNGNRNGAHEKHADAPLSPAPVAAKRISHISDEVIDKYEFDERAQSDIEIMLHAITLLRNEARGEGIVLEAGYDSRNDLVGDAARLDSLRDQYKRLRAEWDRKRKEKMIATVPNA